MVAYAALYAFEFSEIMKMSILLHIGINRLKMRNDVL